MYRDTLGYVGVSVGVSYLWLAATKGMEKNIELFYHSGCNK